ncbi:GTP-binding protein [Roridomyces roridus]|uniref:GTP-binding protein n=1 Tax=Roridomyces roridus TaxID=1738132 RepID=A0AAD7BEN1_9AGAR|nr:GTP-binding protein [Roridomyces roridus]
MALRLDRFVMEFPPTEIVIRAIGLRSKCKHFRILVIGRANAGKTTLLKKVCESIEDPEIYSPSGQRIDLSVVEASAERGEHDIENQLIFKSNRQFVFHDSRGFESGSEEEIEKVTAFIGQRVAARKLSEQLHAIWYCLPTDTNRPILAADELFFNTSAAGKVPVICIFTKFDGLLTEAVSQLVDDGYSFEEAEEGQTEYAAKMLADNFEKPLKANMRIEESDCDELIEKTADALSDKTLRLLFLSVQQNNIDLCTRQVMRE